MAGLPKYTVLQKIERNGKEDKAIWREIGAGWPIKNGKPGEMHIDLDAVPVDGKLVIKLRGEKTSEKDELQEIADVVF